MLEILIKQKLQEIIHSVRTQNFTKNYNFLPPDTNMNVCVSGGKKLSQGVRNFSS